MKTRKKRRRTVPEKDAVTVLREIASDREQPATARVSAARALLALRAGSELIPSRDDLDQISRRAIEIAAERRGRLH